MHWTEQIDKINSKETLCDFVALLRHDLESDGESWENPTLDRFLEAMEAWVREMDGIYTNTGRQPIEIPTWKTFAEILYAAKIYE